MDPGAKVPDRCDVGEGGDRGGGLPFPGQLPGEPQAGHLFWLRLGGWTALLAVLLATLPHPPRFGVTLALLWLLGAGSLWHHRLTLRRANLAIREALRTSEDLFARAFSLSPDSVNINRLSDGTYLVINEGFTAITGYTREEILGQSSVDPRRQVWIHPAEREQLVAGLKADGKVVGMEASFRAKDGRALIGLISANLMEINGEACVLSVIRDITGRKEDEARLRESEARYRAQFDLASEGIMARTPEGDLLEVNEAFARMHGYAREDMLRMHLADLMPPGWRRTPGRQARLLAGIPETFEVVHVHKDGHEFPMEVSASLIHSGGQSLILAFHRDITERRRAEREKAELTSQLLHAQKMESLGSLAGGVAHDMNNVLGAILALSSVQVRAQPAGTPAREAFDIISQAAERGGRMVRSLLKFARQHPVEALELAVNRLIRDEVELLAHATLAKIEVVADLAPDLRPVRGDAAALGNAIMNLCVNAVDAMPDHGTLTLRTRNHNPDWILIEVEDTGAGMSREVLARAMDPFFTTKEVGKGTGLGLSMVYSTVMAHQGQLRITSEPGRGTCVTLQLPACEPGPAAGPAGAPAPEARARVLQVLLVDDDDLVRRSTQILLEALGHRVTAAASGEEALGLLDGGHEPEVAILDMNMPGLGGHGTLPRLRALRPGLPVLLATGRVDQAVLDLAQAHARVSLLPKPFPMDELERLLHQAADHD